MLRVFLTLPLCLGFFLTAQAQTVSQGSTLSPSEADKSEVSEPQSLTDKPARSGDDKDSAKSESENSKSEKIETPSSAQDLDDYFSAAEDEAILGSLCTPPEDPTV